VVLVDNKIKTTIIFDDENRELLMTVLVFDLKLRKIT
jgi:hypothetical protein